MSEENKNKRIANENLSFDENEDEKNNQNSKSIKVAVISGSSNVDNFQENALILRDDQSKVIIKVQNSQVKKSFINELNDQTDKMEDEDEVCENTNEDKANISQKIFESILVIFTLNFIINFNFLFFLKN